MTDRSPNSTRRQVRQGASGPVSVEVTARTMLVALFATILLKLEVIVGGYIRGQLAALSPSHEERRHTEERSRSQQGEAERPSLLVLPRDLAHPSGRVLV